MSSKGLQPNLHGQEAGASMNAAAQQFQPSEPTPKVRTFRSIAALILREMVTTYGRSPGGYLWAVLEPIAAIALLAFAFSLAFRAPSLGTNFALFYATGYLPYMLFHDVSSKTATAIRFSKPLLNFQAITWLDVIFARFLLNVFTHLLVGTLVISALIVAFEIRVYPDIPTIALAASMAAALAFGIGTLNAYLFLAFPVWERLWMIAMRPMFIISGIFFLYKDVPSELREVLWFNPVFHVIGLIRDGFYATYDANYVSMVFVFGVSLGTACLGLLLLRQSADGLIHK